MKTCCNHDCRQGRDCPNAAAPTRLEKLWAFLTTDHAAAFCVGFTCGMGFVAVLVDVACR